MGQDINRIIVVDVEATCWATPQEQGTMPNEVIEIGACELRVRGDTMGDITNAISIPVKPRFTTVSPFCEELTGWSQQMLNERGLSVPAALALFKEHFKVTHLTQWASYGNYDKVMLSSNSDRGIKCVSAASNPFDIMNNHFNIKSLFAMRFKLRRELGLQKALDHLRLTFEGRHHNGMDDSVNTARVLRETLR